VGLASVAEAFRRAVNRLQAQAVDQTLLLPGYVARNPTFSRLIERRGGALEAILAALLRGFSPL
jgi:hypothetical protein